MVKQDEGQSAQVWESECGGVGDEGVQGPPWGRGSIDSGQELAAEPQESPQLGGSLACHVSQTVASRAPGGVAQGPF